MDMQLTNLLTAILLLFFTTNLTAQSFDVLDDSFGESGRVIVDMTDNGDSFQTMCLQSDGKILMAGSDYYGYSQEVGQQSDFAIVRLNEDGSLDDTFGDEGQVITTLGYTREEIITMKVMNSGKILVAGYVIGEEIVDNRRVKKVVLLRYFSDGRLDETFGDGGSVILEEGTISIYTSIIELPDSDKFLLSNHRGAKGHSGSLVRVFSLIGFTESGAIDTTFGKSGYIEYDNQVVDVDHFDGAALHNNQIYLTGLKRINNFYNIVLARFDLTGELDTLFGEHGIAAVDFGYTGGTYARKMAFQPNNSILILGEAIKGPKGDFALARIHQNGQLDKTFGEAGKVTTEFTDYSALAIQSDDNPIDLFLEEDGKILVIGTSGASKPLAITAVAKYESDGRLDFTFGKKGKLLLQNYNGTTYLPRMVLRQADHKIIFGGFIKQEENKSDFQLVRFISDFNVSINNPSLVIPKISVYPNPIKNRAVLSYTLEHQENLTIQLTDLNGRMLETYLQNEPHKAGTYQQQIDLPTYLSTNVYFLNIISPNGQVAIKVFKE